MANGKDQITERRGFSVTRRGILAGAGAAGVIGLGAAAYKLDRPGGKMVNGASRARPIPSDTAIPTSVDVVVIGGGNIGAATALVLAERGISVAVFEKGVVAGEASGRSFGLVENLGIDPVKGEIVGHSKTLWQGMDARTGQPSGYVRNGFVWVFSNEEERAGMEAWMAAVRGMPGFDPRLLSRQEVDALLPGLAVKHAGGISQPSDGQAEPQLAAPSLALGARRHGAQIFQGCAVRGIERTSGKVSGVITERGSVRCQAVVLAGGFWTPLFLRSLGIDLPQFDGGSSSFSTIVPNIPKTPVAIGRSGWRPTWNGRVSMGTFLVPTPIVPNTFRYLPKLLPVMGDALESSYPVFSASTFWNQLTTPNNWAMDKPSPFEEFRVLVSDYDHQRERSTLADASVPYPAFKSAKIAERWGGFLSTTLDNCPVIDRISSVSGLFVASGMNYGLAMAPAVGEALADLIANNKPKVDLSAFRLSRFTDGTPLTFHK